MTKKAYFLDELLRRGFFIGYYDVELRKYFNGKTMFHNENLFRMAEQLCAIKKGWA